MSTVSQDRDFATAVLGTVLEQAIEWIEHNMEPEDVFDVQDLNYWAEENGYVKRED